LSQSLETTGGGRFVIRRQIGTGGMGVVYEVLDRQRQQIMALKTLRQLEPRTLLRFKNEFRALADLQHENLVRLGELFADDDRWFFTMELVRGQDLLSWVRGQPPRRRRTSGAAAAMGIAPTADAFGDDTTSPGPSSHGLTVPEPPPPWDESRLRAALKQLARGLGALHDAGKVHRDVKPPNVLVTGEGRVVLLDFGLVVDADRAGDTDTNIVGTANYMSPEQAASRPVGPEADWYAVGAMLYEALTGRPPFSGPPLAVLMDKQKREATPPGRVVPDVPPDLDAICVELLRRDPAQRLSGAQAVARLTGGSMPRLRTPPVSASPHTPFVGRARELAELRAAWEASRAGESRAITLLITGDSGIGKSALARKFLSDLGERVPEAIVLAARCYEREAVPFKAFDGVIDALSRDLSHFDQVDAALFLPHDAGSLARLFPVLRRVPAVARVPDVRVGSPQELRTRAFSALRELLTRLAERRPLAITIDDFQWADEDSLALLEHLMHGAGAPPLLLLLTGRPGTRLPRLSSDTRTLELTGLDGESARGLVALLVGDEHDPGIDEGVIAAEAGGHPMFLQELVRHAQAGGAAGRVRLDEAIGARVDALEPQARALVEVLAVAGEPLTTSLAADAARLSLAEVHARLPALRAAHLVRVSDGAASDRLECYHDRVREGVTGRLDGVTLRRHHLALAAALEAAGAAAASPLALVRHLEAAGETDRAATHAEVAAGRAAESLAFDRAADLYRTALRLGRHAAEPRRRLTMALADALMNAGRLAEASKAYEEAAQGADASTRLDCRRKAAQYLLTSGDVENGLAALATVLGELGELLPASPRAALARLLWGRARLRLRGVGFQPREAAAIPPQALHRVDVYHAVAIGLGMVDNVRGADFQARGLRAALAVGELHRVVRALDLEAVFLASQGRRTRARVQGLLARCDELTRASDDPFLRAWTAAGHGIVDYLGGHFDAGFEALARAEAVFRDETTEYPWELTTIRIFVALTLRMAGRYAELKRRFDALVPEAARRGDHYGEATVTRVGCIVYLCADAPAEVEPALARCAWHPPPGGYHMQSWYEWRMRAETALYQATPAALPRSGADTIAALKASLLWRVQTTRAEAMWLDGRLALAGGKPEGLALAERHVRRLRRERVPYAAAWAELLVAGVCWRRGDAEGARAALARAADVARAADMRGCVAAAELVLGAVEGGDAGAARRREAEKALGAEGVARPDRFADMLVPGFGVAGASGPATDSR
jgi:serine/threonine protein kinase/tetratricopeptide (TPR) repeat protein